MITLISLGEHFAKILYISCILYKDQYILLSNSSKFIETFKSLCNAYDGGLKQEKHWYDW